MAKKLKKKYKKLDARLKAWQDTISKLSAKTPQSAFRKPGSMKGRA